MVVWHRRCTPKRAKEGPSSGSIVSIDDEAGTIVLAEVGPWKVRGGKTVLTYRTITVTPETQLAIVGRDYSNFDGLHEGKRLVALKITVLEVAAP